MLKRKEDMKWSEAFPLIMDNSILDADTADLIEKMPTVVVDNGNVQAQGEVYYKKMHSRLENLLYIQH